MAVTLNSSTSAGLVITSDTTGSMSLQSSGTTKIAVTSTGAAIAGTNTNDSAAAGYVGEYISNTCSSLAFPTSGAYGDATNISLTAGDWDLTVVGQMQANGATVVHWYLGASTTTGNSATGLVTGDSLVSAITPPNATANAAASLPNIRVSIASTTTYYLKYQGNFSVATPQLWGRISARRVR